MKNGLIELTAEHELKKVTLLQVKKGCFFNYPELNEQLCVVTEDGSYQ